jgi:hypothetical protein
MPVPTSLPLIQTDISSRSPAIFARHVVTQHPEFQNQFSPARFMAVQLMSYVEIFIIMTVSGKTIGRSTLESPLRRSCENSLKQHL